MWRVVLVAWVLVLACGGVSSTQRAPEPTPAAAIVAPEAPEPPVLIEQQGMLLRLAVLGVEVRGPTIDEESVAIARELTLAVRQRASTGYLVAPGEHELVDEKIFANCERETPACMGNIGERSRVDRLLYGHIERRAQSFHVDFTLLDVSKRSVATWSETFPAPKSGSRSPEIDRWARAAYGHLASNGGELVVRVTNGDRGLLLIDGEARAALAHGVARIRLPEGRFRIAIEVDGYRRREEIVTITDGDTTTMEIRLKR